MDSKNNTKNGLVLGRASSVSSATLISRILGYTRDMLIANFFGTTMAADAFFVAYKIPNLLRRLLGEGSLSTSFIPIYTEYLNTKGEEEARKLVRVCFGAFALLFLLLTVLGVIFAPQIVTVIAWGFSEDPEKFALTVKLTRIMFPFLTAIGLAAICLGALNSLKFFFVPAIAPTMLSLSEIVMILFLCPVLSLPIYGLAIGVIVGGFLQFIFQLVPLILKSGNLLPIIDLKHPGLQKILKLMLPAVIGISVLQINSFVDTICATMLSPGSVTRLYYANRLMQLPLALFGTAIATVALPMMSDDASNKNISNLTDTLAFSLRTISFFTIPAIVILVFYPMPIISVLFQRGAFTQTDSFVTARILAYYSSGLLFFAGIKVMASAFYSLQDTKTPVVIASASMILNVILNVVVVTVSPLRENLGASGLALASAVSAVLNFSLLMFIFAKRQGVFAQKDVFISLFKHILSGLIMMFAVIKVSALLFSTNISLFIQVAIVLLLSSLVYLTSSLLLSVPELKLITARLKK